MFSKRVNGKSRFRQQELPVVCLLARVLHDIDLQMARVG